MTALPSQLRTRLDRTAPVLRRLKSFHPLTEAEVALVQACTDAREEHRPGAQLQADGQRVGHPRLILSGWAARQRLLPDGRRQIFGFVLPGDWIAVCPAERPLGATSVMALTRVAAADASALKAAAKDADAWPGLARAVALASLQDEARLLDHLVRLGRQTAYERVAHLLLELHDRMTSVGLAEERCFALPLTQEALADALGLSIVHVNRILQQLRRDKLIEMRAGRVLLLDMAALAQVADYSVSAPAPA